ncbi:MAG: hypothetical protein JEZ12_28640 [Desulfobacterium sp.]|nr:hypothetical protein [Desulfobacterium sp.]
MKELILPQADPLTDQSKPVESVTISISAKIPHTGEIQSLKECGEYYDQLAQKLADALTGSLPQGIIEPLMVKLMESRVSLYRGTMK